jgi:threonylcarbamoyladenosine tRNA methylthiotransferase MtaB
MRIYLDSIGCRLNQAEIERYARQFRAAGHTLVATPEEADIAVVNTCAVTAAAASDSRQKIRQMNRAGAREVVVTGCWSTLNPREAAALPGVSQVVTNASKDSLVPHLLQIAEEAFDLEPLERQPVPGARLRTRAFIKVQDGCDNRCTFCVTTLARGAGRSLSIDTVVADILAACEGGAQEIVLTGVHLGSWGQDLSPGLHLRRLVHSILEHTPTPRLRLSSLEPWDLDEDFFSLWENPRLCRHLHLPLQSGSSRVLERMARKVTPASFAALVRAARQAAPGIAITTDIIAGFPGESAAEFDETLEFVRAQEFAGGHVFTYSARQGTPAARMPDQVPVPVRKERNAALRQVLAQSSATYQAAFIDQTLTVLWETATGVGPDGWTLSGLSDNYLRVHALAPRQVWNQITPVWVTAAGENGLLGQLPEM